MVQQEALEFTSALASSTGTYARKIVVEGADQGNVLNDSLRIYPIDESTAEQWGLSLTTFLKRTCSDKSNIQQEVYGDAGSRRRYAIILLARIRVP